MLRSENQDALKTKGGAAGDYCLARLEIKTEARNTTSYTSLGLLFYLGKSFFSNVLYLQLRLLLFWQLNH